MESINIAKGMNGMALIGSLLGETDKNISAIPFVLAGDLDEQLYMGFFLMHRGPRAPYVEKDPEILVLVDGVKSMLRDFVRVFFECAAREEEMEQRVALERLREDLKQSNKPHAQGTVAEIATKLGISKSEVRRRKADCTLDELFTKQST